MNIFHSQPYGIAEFPLSRRELPFDAERVEGGRDRVRRVFHLGRGACYAMAMTFLLAGVLLYLWPRLQMVNEIYQYRALQTQYQTLSEEHRVLRVQLGTLESLSRIDRLAREKLGMELPDSSQMVFVPLSPQKRTGGYESGVQNSQP